MNNTHNPFKSPREVVKSRPRKKQYGAVKIFIGVSAAGTASGILVEWMLIFFGSNEIRIPVGERFEVGIILALFGFGFGIICAITLWRSVVSRKRLIYIWGIIVIACLALFVSDDPNFSQISKLFGATGIVLLTGIFFWCIGRQLG